MASVKAMASSMLILRIFTLGLLAASIALMVTNSYTESNGDKTSFKDIHAYRFVLSTAAIGAAYTIFQLPFAAYYAAKGKRLIGKRFLPEFDFYGDKLISFVLASGVGAGFAMSFELKRFVDIVFVILVTGGVFLNEDDKTKFKKFLDRGITVSGLLILGFLCMAAVSVLSSINRATTTSNSSGARGYFFR